MGYLSFGSIYDLKGNFIRQIQSLNGIPTEKYDTQNCFFFGEEANYVSFNIIFPTKYKPNRLERNFVDNILNFLIKNYYYNYFTINKYLNFLKKEQHNLILFRRSILYNILCHYFGKDPIIWIEETFIKI